ncbi:gamma-glutamylcyclotransferase [Halonotius terrestris]|uniref:Gamma-glutamylcyclotransferase n=1 Tax=Halonotius terrestris TaxID=2487750 RepID=A0A8J8PE24_9EURY|nr:gamma-glutamylcyclotransferase family protein [Halonotius terrestris]TQQ83600.1 gamma-glutamylcyclotransferase [Halonotius terrestris]
MPELVFVYGTLTDDEQVDGLLDSYRFVGDAVCHGLSRIDGRYPTLVPGDRVNGRLLETDEIRRLDRYEGVDRGLYHRFSLPVADSDDADERPQAGEREAITSDTAGSTTAIVYIGEPAGLGIDTVDTAWPGPGPFDERVADYLGANPVRIII